MTQDVDRNEAVHPASQAAGRAALPTRRGDVLVKYDSANYVVDVVRENGQQDFRYGLVKHQHYHDVVSTAKDLAKGNRIFLLNVGAGTWSEIPTRVA